MEFWKSMSGTLIVEYSCAEPEKIWDEIISSQIPIAQLKQIQEITYQIQIPRNSIKQLSNIMHRKGIDFAIIKKTGTFWHLKHFIHRPILLFFLLLLIFSSLYLPSRIFFISVEGSYSLPEQLILSIAEDCGIRFGASRKAVRSEKMKNTLLSAIPQLQWAGINTKGCVAVISVKERTEVASSQVNMASNLIADYDGYILSSTITNGTAHVHPGDTVKKGQLLVSGFTDCGICIRATRAEGEILAQTNRKIRAIIPTNYNTPRITQKENRIISVIIRKKRINLWKDSRISGTACGRMYEEYYVSLPGGFQLPITFSVDRYFSYDLEESTISNTDAASVLQKFSDNYLMQQMISGQIIQSKHQLTCTDDLYYLESRYTCTEMIGKEQREQIGDFNGKRS